MEFNNWISELLAWMLHKVSVPGTLSESMRWDFFHNLGHYFLFSNHTIPCNATNNSRGCCQCQDKDIQTKFLKQTMCYSIQATVHGLTIQLQILTNITTKREHFNSQYQPLPSESLAAPCNEFWPNPPKLHRWPENATNLCLMQANPLKSGLMVRIKSIELLVR